MEKLTGGILSAAGFRAGAGRGGIKRAEGLADVALIVSDGPAAAAGAFTTNRFAAAPVAWCRRILPSRDVRAIVANSGNANACTGEQGAADAEAMARTVAGLIGCRPEQVCVASTGVIGHPLPMDKIDDGILAAHANLSGRAEAARAAELAIMTTDTRPKAAAVRSSIGGKAFCVGGMAKGSGMIAPQMATMLAFVTSDASVEPRLLDQVLREAVAETFNRITVDGDTSTNDTVLALAGGASGVRVVPEGAELDAFREAVHAVLADLAEQVVTDGEGATKLVEVQVTGGASDRDAERAARAVAESQLFKCAVYGGDPNWGRVVCAVGYSGAAVEPRLVTAHIGDTCVFRGGVPTNVDAAGQMRGPRVTVRIDLGLGQGRATVWTCDLTERYVQINARYHT